MQKRNRKLLSISAAALIMASVGAGFGQTVHADDGSKFSLEMGKSADVGEIDNDADKLDTSQTYSLKDLQRLLNSANSKAESKRVSYISKAMQDKFASALNDAGSAKTNKDANVSYVALANIMDQIDQSLKSGLKSSLEKTQVNGFRQAFSKLDDKSGSQAEQDAKSAIKAAFASSFNVAKQVYADPLASVDSIKLAGQNLDIYRDIVLGANGDDKALDNAKIDVVAQKQELSNSQVELAGQANSDLEKAIGANSKSETMTYLAKSVEAMNKASEDRGLGYLISDAQDYMRTDSFRDLDNNQKLDLLTSLTTAETVEQNPLATPLMRAQAKNALMNDLVLDQNGISPKTHLADSIKRAKALIKAKAFGKNTFKVEVMLTQAEAIQKNGDKAQQEKAAKFLDNIMQAGLSSEVATLTTQVKKLSAKKANKSGKSGNNSDSDSNGSDSNASSDNSGDSSDSDGSKSNTSNKSKKSKKDKNKSDDSVNDSDSDGDSRDDAPATKTEQAESGALPQTGRFILQHAPIIAGMFAVLAGVFGAWLYRNKKHETEKDSNNK